MDSQAHLLTELESVVFKFNELLCTGAGGGVGVGSMIYLMFGDLRERDICIGGKRAVFIEESEIYIHTGCCAWRIETPDRVASSSESCNEIDGPMDVSLALFKNNKIKNITFSRISLDLTVEFYNGVRFIIFCNQFYATDKYDNYSILYLGKLYTIDADGLIRYMTVERW